MIPQDEKQNHSQNKEGRPLNQDEKRKEFSQEHHSDKEKDKDSNLGTDKDSSSKHRI